MRRERHRHPIAIHYSGDVSGDTEFGGTELGSAFTSVMWQPVAVDHGISAPFAVFPDLDTTESELVVPAETEIVVPADWPELIA